VPEPWRTKRWLLPPGAAAILVVAATLGGCSGQPPSTPVAAVSSGPATSTTAQDLQAAPASTVAPRVTVPKLTGLRLASAKTVLAGRGLRWRVSYRSTARFPAGTVIAQSRERGSGVSPDTAIGLVVAKAPPPPPTTAPPPPPTTRPAPNNCDPAYPGVCLHDGIGDYDCQGGSGNGPNYVTGPVRVRPPDPFGLDSDGDGIGCED
jgi:PASTA domain